MKSKKLGIISGFISSEKGQRFFNFAYSIGAAIVIWGALFKILHLPGGNSLLCIGMGTEVLMFILTAFDRPPKEYKWEDVFPVLDSKNPEDRPEFGGGGGGGGVIIAGSGDASALDGVNINAQGAGVVGGPIVQGGVVGGGAFVQGGVIGGGPIVQGGVVGGTVVPGVAPSVAETIDAAPDLASKMTVATQAYVDQIKALATEMEQLHETTEALNRVSQVLLGSYEAITQHSTEISDSSTGYVEQMQGLNRNISGLNTIYEIQLKSVSSQLDAIDRVNRGIKDIRDMYEKSAEQSTRYCEETEKMARYMQQLNKVYEKMITAMTINMYRPMADPMAAAPMPDPAPVQPQQSEPVTPAPQQPEYE